MIHFALPNNRNRLKATMRMCRKTWHTLAVIHAPAVTKFEVHAQIAARQRSGRARFTIAARELVIVEGAGHFFEKQMDELQGHIDGYLAERFGDQA